MIEWLLLIVLLLPPTLVIGQPLLLLMHGKNLFHENVLGIYHSIPIPSTK